MPLFDLISEHAVYLQLRCYKKLQPNISLFRPLKKAVVGFEVHSSYLIKDKMFQAASMRAFIVFLFQMLNSELQITIRSMR